MGDQQNLESHSLKDRAWTTDEIRKHSSNWTLAGDVGLFNLLNEFAHQIISRTHEVENAVDSLVHQTKMTTAKINNVINDFHMLSNLQFVENRVYDEEIQESVSENKPATEKTKEQKEAEMLPKIVQAIELGLAVLDTAFDRINVNEISDSEDEEDISSEGRTILEPKDPYEHRPLPYIIGSEEFMKCDHAGLKDLIEDDAPSFSEESSISETDETSSDEGEPLPLDDDDDDDRFSEKPNDNISQSIREKMSSSDESELFGSEKEVNGFGSETSLDFKSKEKNTYKVPTAVQPVKDTRQNSISSLQSKLKLPQVLPVPKLQEKEGSDDIFAVEDHSDDESPFRKKTGLFVSDIRFNDEKDGDLFGGDLFGKSPSKEDKEIRPEVPEVMPKKPQSAVVSGTKKQALFDNDEDSEDDIFNTLMKTKKPTTTKTSNAGSQDSSEKADTSSTPSSAPSTKPSGNAFDFVTGGGSSALFGDDSDGDDLFSSKKTQGKKFEYDSSENDDLFGTIGFKDSTDSKVVSDTKSSLFEDKKAPEQKKELERTRIAKMTKDSIFEDSDSSDQEKPVVVKSPLTVPNKSKKQISLFDDDDDLEEDIFTTVNKKSKSSNADEKPKHLNLFEDSEEVIKVSKPSKTVEKGESPSLFEDSGKIIKATKPSKTDEKSKPPSLFEDSEKVSNQSKPSKADGKIKSLSLFEDSEEEPAAILPSVSKTQPSKLSLFEDTENLDLFVPNQSVKLNEPRPVEAIKHVPKPVVEIPKVKDDDDMITSKASSPTKSADTNRQVSFDTPIDSSNILNVINKDRVKVTTKRRKPTRQGRLAALENSEKEVKMDSKAPVMKSDLSAVDEDSNSLFSATKAAVKAETPKLDHKAQEKKKMNIMSQLISEVATSKIALKKATEKEDEEEDEVDIFSEITKKDRSGSSFSFRPPEENGIAAVFPIEKKEDTKEDSAISKSDSFEDDFFTEPAFQNFRSSISHKDSVLNLDDDSDDDDLFSAIKSNALPKTKIEAAESNDLFGDDTDIFADVQKEKYEMFPNQIYDDEDDDIFSHMSNTGSNKPTNKASNSSAIKKVETQQVNAFDDPLTGLLGEE